MSTPSRILKLTLEEYFDFESKCETRNEYVDGQVFAMSGPTRSHQIICGNFHAFLHQALAGSTCRAFLSGMKLNLSRKNCIYYPDLMVSCEQQSADALFLENPKLIVEVASKSTRSIDRREKLAAYTSIESLIEYVLVEQSRMSLTVIRRLNDSEWQTAEHSRDELYSLQSLQLKDLPVNDLYDGIDFVPTVKELEDYEDFYVVNQQRWEGHNSNKPHL